MATTTLEEPADKPPIHLDSLEDELREDSKSSLFDPSIEGNATISSQDVILTTPSAQLSYNGRPASQPTERVFKLEDTKLLDYAQNTSNIELLAVVGVNTQDSDTWSATAQQPSSPVEHLTIRGGNVKKIAAPAADNRHSRPDIKRSQKYPMQQDHNMMKTLSLTGLYGGEAYKPPREDPFNDPTGHLKNNSLRPKRIDTFPNQESKLAQATHMKTLKTLRKYKHGVSPDKKLQMIDRHLQKQLKSTMALAPHNDGSKPWPSYSKDTSEVATMEFSIDVNPPSPMGRVSGVNGMDDDRSAQSHHSQGVTAQIVQPVLISRKKEIVIKNIPEEKLGYYKRVTVDVTSALSSANSVSANSTALSTADNSGATARDTNSADSSTNRLVSKMMTELQRSPFEKELQGETGSSPNNPLHRYRMEQSAAERVSTREPIRCCRCSKDSSFWCRQCSLSYCHNCWSLVPHHGFISTTGLPTRPNTTCEQDIPFSAFPALKKKYGETAMLSSQGGDEHTPVYSPTRSSVSRIGSTIRMLGQDKPFYKGLDMSDDAVDAIDLTLFGGLEGMKGNGPPRPTSARGKEPGQWRKPVGNPNKERGVLAPKKKRKGKKGKQLTVNIPSLSVSQNVAGRSTVSLGSSGAPPLYAYPMTGFTHDYFPEDWKSTRPRSEITVYKGVPVYTNLPPEPEPEERKNTGDKKKEKNVTF